MRNFDFVLRNLFWISLSLLLASCQEAKTEAERCSAYYWSTTLEVDTAFLRAHDIGRLYVRYFDVVWEKSGKSVPNATLRFRGGVPEEVEVVPVVFIVNDVMRQETAGLAEKILTRVMQMSDTHGVEGVREVQIDCDWTATTRRRYDDFMQQLRQLAHARGLQLSTTIRLHQLSQTPPPADRGVLMLYNTGDFRRFDSQNPIIDFADVEPYLRQLRRYRLPLSAAYPSFGYRLLFREGRYVGILHHDGEYPILPGDSIVERHADLQQVLAVKHAVNALRPDLHREIIIFDLKRKNEHYEEIYHQ